MTEHHHPPADPTPPDPPAAAEAAETYALPVSVAQQRFWYLDQLDPGNPASNIALRFDLDGPLDRGGLHRAVAEVVRRHESLRTTFAEADGQPVQVVHPAAAVDLPCDDLTGLAEADRAARAEAITRDEGGRPFDLTAGPLLRVRLLRLAADRHALLLTVHHIVADGWSTGVLLDELAAVYEAYALGRPSPLPEPALQYGDYAIWERQSLADASLDGQLRYWVGQLAGRPTGSVPTDKPRPAHRPATGGMESVLLTRELTDRLADLARRRGATLFMLSLAAVKVLVARLSGATDVCVGSLTAGRSRVELEPLVGVFVNPLAFRTRLDGDPTFTQFLDRVRGTVVDGLANQDVPFDRVLDAVHPPRHPDRHPLFQVNLLLQRAFLKPHRVAGLSIRPEPSISPGALYDLNFIMVERAEGWRLSCEYNPDLFEARVVRRALDLLTAVFREVDADPDRPVSDILGGWRPTAPPPPADPPRPTPGQPVPPRTETEERLYKLWAEVLRADGFGVHDDFFDLGGHSMLVARLLYKVGQEFGIKLSFGAFLGSPTIEKLAARLTARDAQPWMDQVIPLQPIGTRPKLVLIDPHDLYVEVIRGLGPDQPVYGLYLPHADNLPPNHTLEDIAASLVDVLVQFQPTGPYCLGGWCNMGVIAFEVARQLRARGRQVAVLALIDSWNPVYSAHLRTLSALPVRLSVHYSKLRYLLQRVRRNGLRGVPRVLGVRLRDKLRKWKMAFWRLRYHSLKMPVPAAIANMTDYKTLPVAAYAPKPYDSKVLLVTTGSVRRSKAIDPRQGWGAVAADGLAVLPLDCDHGQVFTAPAAGQIARAVARLIPDAGGVAEPPAGGHSHARPGQVAELAQV
ncbi:MAG: condensation domain-containing protein [Gemmataceae bacterium]